MRVEDAEDSIFDGLLALSWRPYLTAMWVLCDELRYLYSDWLVHGEGKLMASTMDLMRDVAITGDEVESGRRAFGLAEEWQQLASEWREELPPGLGNAWITFKALTEEIACIGGRYDGANWVTNAVTNRWETLDERAGPRAVDFNRETDDDSPLGKSLTRFKMIVQCVTEMSEKEHDPYRIRAMTYAGLGPPPASWASGPAQPLFEA